MKKTSILFLILLIGHSLFAKKVELEAAKNVAMNYYSLQVKAIKDLTINDPVISETIKLGRDHEDLIYVFNFKDGFVMVAADDGFTPVLGFSLEGKFSDKNMPPALDELIESYKDQISHTVKSRAATPAEVIKEWAIYSNTHQTRASGNCQVWPKFITKDPLLTTTWDQICYYNEKCPADARSSYCGKVPAGCVAAAMAQVMKYWNYPATGAGSHSYTDTDDNSGQCPGSYGYQYANFGGTSYNWASMPNSISSSNDAISTLMYHCGVSVDMDYGYNCSNINGAAVQTKITTALINNFRYSSSVKFMARNGASDPNWESNLREELDNNRPVIYAASNSSGNHVFILDGYTKMQDQCCTYTANFHVNWGWSGASNGYYTLDGLIYPYAPVAIVGIKPSTYNYPVPSAPNYISEPACSPHCINIDVDYFVPSVKNATSYEWQITGIYGASIFVNGRYATINSHRYGTGTLWCRAINSVGVAGPWATSAITISNCLGRSSENKKAISEIQIFPNPASNSVYINLPDQENYSKIELLDTQGKVLKTILTDGNKNLVIGTENINNGLYLIKLISSQGIELKKIAILK